MLFLDKGFKYEPYLCNGCHYLMQKAMNFNDADFVSVKGNDYSEYIYDIFIYIYINDYIYNIMKSSNLNEKGGLL